MVVDFLLNIWRRLRGPSEAGRINENATLETLKKAYELWVTGDARAAALVYEDVLEADPHNVEAITNLGVCLASLGDNARAEELFERAYLLDDTYLPGVLNHARLLVDRRKSSEALSFFKHVWCCDPNVAPLYTLYSALCLNIGEAQKSVDFQKKGWLGEFDLLRSADGYLFKLTYAESSEKLVASEHVFWAETQRSLKISECQPSIPMRSLSGRRMRIGYWSPDLRNHSVRYFFRPLLEGHDNSSVEVYVYHDNHAEDSQTELIKKASEHYVNVYELSDQALYDLIVSHDLDVLVELAGHTSANRLPLLNHKMASIQVTALGYPPTTGMASVDFKVVDRYVYTSNASMYYAEEPLVLPQSFWCFDPMEDAPVTLIPPVERNGYMTYACVGNLAKINARMIACWHQILNRVTTARLALRSISFEDTAAFDVIRKQFSDAGLPMDRVDLLPPAGGKDFFESYAEVDVILDTYPFNGGTTTCFATYMGVPVVSLYGQSLTSRMGLSVLSNLGVEHLAVDNDADYVLRAVELAENLVFLRDLRATTRARFRASSLGNGEMFAADFESACRGALLRCEERVDNYSHSVDPLPESEVVRRAYRVLASGNLDAAKRILKYIGKYYPLSAQVVLLHANIVAADEGLDAAVGILKDQFSQWSSGERVPALISLIHWCLQLNRLEDARQYARMLDSIDIDDPFDKMQSSLFQVALNGGGDVLCEADVGLPSDPVCVSVLIPTEDHDRFEAMRLNFIERCCFPPTWRITIERCGVISRHLDYKRRLGGDVDILLIVQENVEIWSPNFFNEIWRALRDFDVVGFAGSNHWTQLDWRRNEVMSKAAGFSVLATGELGCEVKLLGPGADAIVGDVAVLDGALLAINAKNLNEVSFDEELLSSEWLLEEEWVYRVGRAGGRLAVHRSLGVNLLPRMVSAQAGDGYARMHWLEKYRVDPFVSQVEDDMYASVLVEDAYKGYEVLRSFTHR